MEESAEDSEVFGTIKEIVFDEMSHLGLACNMLTTIGGTPRLADADVVPKYPGPLPGGVRPGLTVSLGGLSTQTVDMYSEIEKPEDPVVESETAGVSIGAFYSAVLEAFRNNQNLIAGTRQVTRLMAADHGMGNDVVALNSFADVEQAITIIKEQGEGTAASPDNPFPGQPGEMAHYYSFREIFHGHKLVVLPGDPPRFDFVGAEIPMPPVLRMATVPKGGWDNGPSPVDASTRQLLDTFNRRYSLMLCDLQSAWMTGTTQPLGQAVGQMVQLKALARQLMHVPLPGGSGKTYGPEFRYVEENP
ncbi:ferritin-like protein [Streptomyces sp. NPDC049577]|uniref:ferritin-like domain-containing protein n=1 Tax=Streptomyces sp. NPDC049577 TaxID=3155153 RepID=UPI003421FC8D